MSHTPGPWTLVDIVTIVGADGIVVADVLHAHNLRDITLMAASADLLAACQAALRIFGDTKAPIVEQMRAAVEKAGADIPKLGGVK